MEWHRGYPVARVVKITRLRRGQGTQLTVVCPFGCGYHYHGGGDHGADLGHRRPHCVPLEKRGNGYWILNARTVADGSRERD